MSSGRPLAVTIITGMGFVRVSAFSVAKASNPFTRGVVRGAGYVPNDTGESTLEACVARIRAGRTVLLFPEGTRSPRGELGPFRRGAAHVALAAGVPALPISISCRPPGLMRGQAWYEVPERRMQYTLQASHEGLALPLYSHMTDEELDRVCRHVEGLLS